MAHRVRADHEKLDQQLTTLATKRDTRLESFQSGTYEMVLKDQLEKLNDKEFETAFRRVMDRGHTEALQVIRTSRSDLRDPEISRIFSEAVPMIQAHRMVTRDTNRASGESSELGGQ